MSAPDAETPQTIVVEPQGDGDEKTTLSNGSTEAAPIASAGEVILAVDTPWNVDGFDPSIEGCPRIARSGTAVPAGLADQAVSIGAANGVSIVKR
jgi:hypothetical protein